MFCHVRVTSVCKMVLTMWAEALFDWATFLGYGWILRVKWIVAQVLSFLMVLIILLWLSMFMYGCFYYTYMPSVAHERDVHLQFRSDCDRDNGVCSFPAANVSLSSRGQAAVLMRGQQYVVNLDIDMPESKVNQNLGMFMVSLQFYSSHGAAVHTSSRAAILHYKSPLLQALETIFFVPSLLFGYIEQKQQVSVQMFDNYQEDPYKPALGVYVEVQSKRIELYRTKLRIHAKFSGLRYIMYYWPMTSAFIGISTNLVFLILITLLSWYRYGLGGSTETRYPDAGDTPMYPSEGGVTMLSSSSMSISRGPELTERRARVRALLEQEGRAQRRDLEADDPQPLGRQAAAPGLFSEARDIPERVPEDLPSASSEAQALLRGTERPSPLVSSLDDFLLDQSGDSGGSAESGTLEGIMDSEAAGVRQRRMEQSRSS